MSTPDSPRTLVLLRHAKSAYPPGVPDHARPLADRGDRQAALAGEHIRTIVASFDLVLCSSSTRTRQTLARTALGDDVPVDYRDEIYGADPDEILDLIFDVPDSVRNLLVVGHFPGIPELAEELAGPGSDADAVDGVGGKFPTSAFAVVTVDGSWAGLPGGARLTGFTVPREHP